MYLRSKRIKLDSKAKPCIFLGYGSDEFGYRLWVFKNKKVIRSRDVVFCEDKMFVDSGKDKESENIDIILDLISTPSPLPHSSDVQDMHVENEASS